MPNALDPVRCSVSVKLSPKDAFDRFVGAIGRWWPLSYTFGGDRVQSIEIERVVGGRWFERDAADKQTDWGEVRVFEPGRRLVLSFGVSPKRQPEPPERASEVEIRFLPAGDGTRLELEHRDFAKHGEGAETLREGMASTQGWPVILASFARDVRYSA